MKEKKVSRRKDKWCKFFFTDAGCRKGKECRFLHDITKEEMAEKRRCWTCGAVDHLSPSCPRKSGSESPKKGKALKAEGGKTGQQSQKDGSGSPTSSTTSMKDLLEEASKLLKSYQEPPTPSFFYDIFREKRIRRRIKRRNFGKTPSADQVHEDLQAAADWTWNTSRTD